MNFLDFLGAYNCYVKSNITATIKMCVCVLMFSPFPDGINHFFLVTSKSRCEHLKKNYSNLQKTKKKAQQRR